MKEQMRQRLMTQYPTWHESPLRLTVNEIENPSIVMSHFFTRYSLSQIRACLKELLHDSLCADGVDAPSHITTHEDIEKLVEAAWIIHDKQHGNAKQKIVVDNNGNQNIRRYNAIHEFFDSFPLPLARSYLRSSLKAAECDRIWTRATPNDLLFFFERLAALLSEVFQIANNYSKNENAVLPISSEAPDLLQYHLYCGTYDRYKPWDYVPRFLNTKEYNDPYIALQKIVDWKSKKEWKRNLSEILSYALGASSLSEMGVNLELVKLQSLLGKMIEAGHLINVRTVVKENNL